jgi:hypothetical protein
MGERPLDEFNHEREILDQAHTQNEAGRDAFLAVAHTALFAASVSFVGDLRPIENLVWVGALISAWIAGVTGLLALTVSFSAARRAIDARRAALNDPIAPTNLFAERLNGVALWSFPAALLCLFSFVTSNVVRPNASSPKATRVTGQHHQTGNYATKTHTVSRGPVRTMDWRYSRSPCSLTAAPAPCTKRTW